MLDAFQLLCIQLVRLREDFLPYADFAKVMQQGGVAEFAQFLLRKTQPGPGTLGEPFELARQGNGTGGNTQTVSGGDRVTLFNRGDCSGNEALEQLLNLSVEPAILQADRGL